jgi:hypothetical protein
VGLEDCLHVGDVAVGTVIDRQLFEHSDRHGHRFGEDVAVSACNGRHVVPSFSCMTEAIRMLILTGLAAPKKGQQPGQGHV